MAKRSAHITVSTCTCVCNLSKSVGKLHADDGFVDGIDVLRISGIDLATVAADIEYHWLNVLIAQYAAR